MGSSQFSNQEIYVYYLVSVDCNGMAARLTRSDCEESKAVDGTDDMLWNDSDEDKDVTSKFEKDGGTDGEDGDNDTD